MTRDTQAVGSPTLSVLGSEGRSPHALISVSAGRPGVGGDRRQRGRTPRPRLREYRRARPRHQRGVRRRRQRGRRLQRDDFVELCNTTDAAIIARRRLSVQYRSATGTASPSSPAALTGIDLPAGGTLPGQRERPGPPARRCRRPTPTEHLPDGRAPAGRSSSSDRQAPRSRRHPGNISERPRRSTSSAGDTATQFEDRCGPATTNAPSVSRDRSAAGTDTNDNCADFSLSDPPPGACGSACTATPPRRRSTRSPRSRARATPRRSNGHAGDHPGCRHRGVPHRRLLRLRAPDRRHRLGRRRDPGRLRRGLRPPARR